MRWCNLTWSSGGAQAHVDGWVNDRWRLSAHCFLGLARQSLPPD